jgi:Transposase IS66 family
MLSNPSSSMIRSAVERYFFEAKDSSAELAEHALEEIRLLYEVERELRETDASFEERRRRRQEKSVPVLNRFKTWLEANEGLPQSPWGKALKYSLVRWKKLSRYTEDGRVEIGRVERWRGGLGSAYLFPPLSFGGASIAGPCSVSTSRSSNRTCRFPASGSHL